jgi:hypothetical protein
MACAHAVDRFCIHLPGPLCNLGVDYEVILRQAEAEADVIVWDGGNNEVCLDTAAATLSGEATQPAWCTHLTPHTPHPTPH